MNNPTTPQPHNPTTTLTAPELRRMYAETTERLSEGRHLMRELVATGAPRSNRRRKRLSRNIADLDDLKCRISEQLQFMGEA